MSDQQLAELIVSDTEAAKEALSQHLAGLELKLKALEEANNAVKGRLLAQQPRHIPDNVVSIFEPRGWGKV